MVWTSPGSARRYGGSALLVVLLVCACGAHAVRGSTHSVRASVRCDLYASPSGHPELQRAPSGSAARHRHHHHGTLRHPFKSAQALARALRPGQTGCLEPGTYDLRGQLRLGRSGRPHAPITLAGYPSRHATLRGGYVEISHGADYVVLRGLRINTAHAGQVGVQILAAHDSLLYSNVTNHTTHYSCIIVGSDTGYGRASHTLIQGNVIHQCGYNPGDPYEDHGIYVDNSGHAIIQKNILWGMPYGWGVQLYPHSVGTQVLHNIIVDNRQGVVFGGNGAYTSSDNLVAYNIITSGSAGYDIQSYWGGSVGTDNRAEYNCLYSGHRAEIQRPTKGFQALHNVIAHPRYVNATEHNYTLRSTSPCRSMIG
jgi:hypothetical protein